MILNACLLLIVLLFLPTPRVHAQATARDKTIAMSAVTSGTPPHVTLHWPPTSFPGTTLYVRVKGSESWGNAIPLPDHATSYADAAAQPGVIYEYSLHQNNTSTVTGALAAGYLVPLVEQRGRVILLVDASMSTPLAPEISRLEQNMAADGWVVHRHDVARESVAPATGGTGVGPARLAALQNVRTILQNVYATAPAANWNLVILGRVPVPYAGNTAYDGHVDHGGAWPTDFYYSNLDDNWTDTSVNNSAPSDPRNDNIIGDGKFDSVPNAFLAKLGTGRVDLSNMNNVPTGMSETQLLRQYLVRNHNFRRNIGPYSTVARRGIVDPNFGASFADVGWRNGMAMFGSAPGQMDELDYLTTLQTTPMLFAYGCGSGSWTSAVGIGDSVVDFGKKDVKAVFHTLFGSYFGDWDRADNLLKAPLAGTPDSLGLCDAWNGLLLYHMALGDCIGNCTRFSQNNRPASVLQGWQIPEFGSPPCNVNLMGDPTLRLHSVTPPFRVTASSAAGGVTLSWQASPDAAVTGYHVYRGTTANGPFTRLTGAAADAANPTGTPLAASATTWTDVNPPTGTASTYLVKAVKIESSPSGTYVNQSVGEAVSITHQAAPPAPMAPTRLTVTRTANRTCVLTWDDNATDETGYLIERRDPNSGLWSQIRTRPANSTGWSDTLSYEGNIAYYRVRASGGTNSAYSNEAADYGLFGIIGSNDFSYVVDRTTGSFSPSASRTLGTACDIGASYATSDLLSTAGSDYTATSGTVTWSHGQTGSKTIVPAIALTPLPSPQLTRIIRVTYSNPTNGASLGNPPITYGFITEPAALILPNPWATTTLGTMTPGKEGYAEQAGGVFGIAGLSMTIRGGLASDSGRFLYMPVTGNCQLTARLTYLPKDFNNENIQAGIMIRGGLGASDVTNMLLQSTWKTSFRYSRSISGMNLTGAGTTNPINYDPFVAPIWMRLTRTNNTVSISQSLDGVNWTLANADENLANLPATAYVGMILSTTSAGVVPTGPLNYVRFDNVSVTSSSTLPSTVTGLTASATGNQSGQITLTWNATSGATSYLLERSTSSGSGFTQISQPTTHAFTDGGLTAGVTYYYRVKAVNAAGQSAAYSAESSSIPYLVPTIAGWRYENFGTEANTGGAADMAAPAGDGIVNLLKYATGYAAMTSTPSVGGSAGSELVGETSYMTLRITRRATANDVTMTVEAANGLDGPWTSIDPLLPANQILLQPNTPSAGIQTIVVKDAQPMGASPTRFMRIRVRSN